MEREPAEPIKAAMRSALQTENGSALLPSASGGPPRPRRQSLHIAARIPRPIRRGLARSKDAQGTAGRAPGHDAERCASVASTPNSPSVRRHRKPRDITSQRLSRRDVEPVTDAAVDTRQPRLRDHRVQLRGLPGKGGGQLFAADAEMQLVSRGIRRVVGLPHRRDNQDRGIRLPRPNILVHHLGIPAPDRRVEHRGAEQGIQVRRLALGQAVLATRPSPLASSTRLWCAGPCRSPRTWRSVFARRCGCRKFVGLRRGRC